MTITTIPNIFHFINIGPREFNLLHFMSIYSAYKLNNPDKIYLYQDHEQENNIYYEILKDIVTFEFVQSPTEINGITLDSYQYKADIIRMNKLIEIGGIYMDLDVISLKPILKFLDYHIVLGSELSDNPNTTNLEEFKSITNAIILSEPNNEFMKEWLRQMPDNIENKPWAYHAVCLPKNILLDDMYNVHLEPSKTFMPFCFRNPYIFDNYQKYMIDNLDDSHTMHLWETIWNYEYISKFNVKYFLDNDNIFTNICKQYLEVMYNDINKLDIIIENLEITNSDNDKLDMYKQMKYNLSQLF